MGIQVVKRSCDICGNEILGKGYVEMTLNDQRRSNGIKRDDVCLECFDRLRSYIRWGMPRVKDIVEDAKPKN